IGFNIPNELPVATFVAVQGALEMVKLLYRLQTEEQSLILPGISIERGEVMVSHDKQGYHVQGEVVEISQNMAQHGEEGMIVIPRGIHQDIQSAGSTFKVAGKSEITLNNYDEPLKVTRITLPDQLAATTDTLRELVQEDNLTPAQVIIAEDNPALRVAFAKVLRKGGFRVKAAANGYEVLQYLNQGIPDVMVMDVGLPGYSGLELLRKIRAVEAKQNHHVFIIMVTGNHLAEQSPEAELADLFLLKPVSTRDLVNLVQRFMTDKTASDTTATK
ncbi:MAG TPA: response regulator, partial [Phototrophicaceae bacterium]|nr:response regulator [Phototrophicaceae bacterium]